MLYNNFSGYLREKYGFKKIQIVENDILRPFDINISTKEE